MTEPADRHPGSRMLWTLVSVAVRGFYAREEMWRPMLLGTAIAIAAVPLYLALGRAQGAVGLALAGAPAVDGLALAGAQTLPPHADVPPCAPPPGRVRRMGDYGKRTQYT